MNAASLDGHVLELLEIADAGDAPADSLTSDFFRKRKYFGSHDRRYVSDLFFLILRNRRFLDTVRNQSLFDLNAGELPQRGGNYLSLIAAEHLLAGRTSADIAQVSRLQWHSFQPPEDVEGFLNRCKANADLGFIHSETDRLAIRLSFPDWFAARIYTQYAGEAGALLQALNTPAKTVLRVNSTRCTRDACRDRLLEEGVETVPTPHSPVGLVATKRFNRNGLHSFADGWFEVQDEGSQLIGQMLPLSAGMTVIDFCAGAGGKTLQIADRMEDRGEVIALDSNDARLLELKRRTLRAGYQSIKVLTSTEYKPEDLFGKADIVLVDAPCSGSGTIRRNPGMKAVLTESLVRHYHDLQVKILDSAERCVKPGGLLAYSTCSLLAEENQESVNGFLGSHPDFRLTPPVSRIDAASAGAEGTISILPHTLDADGFFLAFLERKS